MTDPIASMLTTIRNALTRKKSEVILPFSKTKFSIAEILKKGDFIERVEKINENYGEIKIILKYNEKGEPAIKSLEKISKSGRRVYTSAKEIPYVLEGPGIIIISTSCGLMTNKEAKKRKLGGEVICKIY